MIQLIKRKKPSILFENEEKWLTELMEYINTDKKVPENVQRRYAHEDIKHALIEETHHKCVYCESKITHIDYGDIEHIKPKSKFREKTFDWANLTLACKKCNINKGNYYEEELPLLNPYDDIVEEKIIYFGPIPSSRSPRAKLTIKKLKLDRPELIERRTESLKNIQSFIDNYQSTDDKVLKELIYHDLLKYTENESEYSAMMKSVVNTVKHPSTTRR